MKLNVFFGIGLSALLSVAFIAPSQADEPLSKPDHTKAAPSSANSAPSFDRSSERIYNLPGLSNTGRVAPGIYRGALPEADGYATLKKLGIKTVIDLRTTGSEKENVEALGMKSISIPIRMSRDGLRAKVERVVTLMADPANQPVYVHCRHGQDRTGVVVAAYRMKHQGWSLADSETDMQAFGFNDIWVNFKKFIRQYGKQFEDNKPLAGSYKK